ATTYSQAGQFELCRYHLQELAEHGSTEESRKLGQEQLEELEHWLKQTEQDTMLRQLQLESLRKRIQSCQGSADDFQRLGGLLLQMNASEPGQFWLDEAISVLEQGRQSFPDAVGILEYLANCYAHKDPDNRLDLEKVLDKLEKVAPDSPVLEIFRNTDDSENREFLEQRLQQAHRLLDQSQSEDPKLRTSALRELQKMINMAPNNSDYRVVYAFALTGTGQYEAALQQAQLVAAIAGESHEIHFNLGQIFWMCGDPDRGRHHLELSLHYARNDRQRQDVMERIADLSKG
ncbi:MAG: hypothetical protein WBM86_08200, partial [Waterburya sp.]